MPESINGKDEACAYYSAAKTCLADSGLTLHEEALAYLAENSQKALDREKWSISGINRMRYTGPKVERMTISMMH